MDVNGAYETLLFDLRRRGVRMVSKKDVWHQRLIALLLRVLTLGGQSLYLVRYVTTIGRTIYLTPDWEERSIEDRYMTLRHELVHVEQFRRFGLIPMAFAYLLVPLPLGFAWCRMVLEREAYEETVRAAFEMGGREATDELREHVIRQFTSAAYGWMWPFPKNVARWYDEFVDYVEAASSLN
jgi:hypothetical protein